jgi:hypothetical protein
MIGVSVDFPVGEDPLAVKRTGNEYEDMRTLMQKQNEHLSTMLNNPYLKNVMSGDGVQMNAMSDEGLKTLGGGINKHGITKATYTTMRDQQGNLAEKFRETLDPTLAGLRDKYSVEGDSRWAQLQKEQLNKQMLGQQDQARLQANAGLQQGLGSLAMRGGLRGGANERMAMGNQRNLMSNIQNIGAANQANQLKVSLADEEMKNKVLGSIGSTGQGIQGRNLGKLGTDYMAQNKFGMQQYSDDMAGYGAERTAAAQSSGGGGGMCFITTACCELLGLPDDNAMLNTFRKFRDEHLGGKEGVAEYYEKAPLVLEVMDKKNEIKYLYNILSDYLVPCHKLIKEEKHDEAYKLYCDMFNHLKEKYIRE